MKKHIKKKLLHELELSAEAKDALETSNAGIPINQVHLLKKIPKDVNLYLITDDNKMFKAFEFRFQGHPKLIPEPDPILIYFHAAYLNFKQIEPKKKVIFEKLSQPVMTEVMLNELYEFFSYTSGFVVLLFTALEALINRCVKVDFVYRRVSERKMELFTKKQIEQYIPFDEKLKKVLFDATGKSFEKEHPVKYQHLVNLKGFRDMIVHTKEAESSATYDYLYKKALTFNYTETLSVARDFCNFYLKEDFVEECNCSHDW